MWEFRTHRTCEYTIEYGEEAWTQESSTNRHLWMVDDISSSDLCLNFKNVCLKMSRTTNPASLSDIRLLALNDIYKFDKNFSTSVSKYFSVKVHNSLKSLVNLNKYLPTPGLKCCDRCLDIERSPPDDWLSSVTRFDISLSI
ncbi:uncharacterized protein EV154DRAFT_220782 [Mucor mucedo]|uniref:uncharacterized protein n=1 Tax=Mucor mucedo TaxID=29922 RepID=UPI002220CCE9|nr:uncharacterized protein EV154DRAFT_220782 [Mucor mucedo]KAI7891522.1 hypothetical protein EV154DRAFT_220782 [Mucor mucedo]